MLIRVLRARRPRGARRIDIQRASVAKRTERGLATRLGCGRQMREALLETYTLVVDGIGIIAFAAVLAVQRTRRRAEDVRPK